ncbi:serine/threonine-protein kinase, partial [Actinoplanes octamycinicus]
MENGLLIDGRYRLLERLGQGGMSVVWRAEDDVLGREVAVKVLSAQLAADANLLHQLHAEARAAAGLRHPMVVAVHDYGETTYRGTVLPYVVMELVDGRTLTELLSGAALPWRLAVLICAQVAAALAAAHERGVVHRDVKPGNVMVGSGGVKLVDFGISAAVGVMEGTDGQLLGTPAYLAPERIKGGPVRPATDVYALGLLLYQSLAGRMPWDASTATQMLKAHYYAEPAPLPDVPGLPSPVARLVPRCLAKAPGERPTAAEVAHVLGEIAGLPPASLLHTTAAPTVAPVSDRPRRPHRTATQPVRAGRTRRPGRRGLAA